MYFIYLLACSLSYQEQVQLTYLECLKDPPTIQVDNLVLTRPEQCDKILEPIILELKTEN
jgi:hypothetical protein